MEGRKACFRDRNNLRRAASAFAGWLSFGVARGFLTSMIDWLLTSESGKNSVAVSSMAAAAPLLLPLAPNPPESIIQSIAIA